jgi:sugar phosphate isomerase/epimerase
MKISNYSLNYARFIERGEMDAFGFLEVCRQMSVEGASLHVNNLAGTTTEYLSKIRRAYLDKGLSISLFTVSTDFGRPEEDQSVEMEKATTAIRAAAFLGAPLLRVFAGSPTSEAERSVCFQRAAAGIRRVCQEAAEFGLPVGLQNHNHGALCRTGSEVLDFIKAVKHPNLTFVLDCGQFAGSKGASGKPPAELAGADYLESIRQTAPLARHVRAKFYKPGPDGSEPWIDYPRIANVLHAVHYHGFVDIVYEPSHHANSAEGVKTAIPRIVRFLRSTMKPE